MRVLFFEAFSGVSGDMMVGALLDLGVPLDDLERGLRGLPMTGFSLSAEKVTKCGIRATQFRVQLIEDVAASPGHPHDSFGQIREMLLSSSLSPWVREKSLAAFHRLAQAESQVHGQPLDAVHFHEIGAVDSIVDIVGTMIAVERLLPLRIVSSPLNVGRGTFRCRHGLYPVPGPATERLLHGIPTYSDAIDGELTTPTGAALMATLADEFAHRPLLRVERTGYGAGTRDYDESANVLMASLSEASTPDRATPQGETVAVLETAIDDMNPQIFSYFHERALQAGALDVYLTPIQMKKGRPAVNLTVLCRSQDREGLTRLMFAETTTLGIRYSFAHREVLEREFRRVETEYGPVSIKLGRLDGRTVNIAPEYEDCRRLAAENGVALKSVQQAALRAYFAADSTDDG